MAKKLTPTLIENLVKTTTYMQDGTLTVCILNLTNGAKVIGKSNAISSENYDEQVGKDVAYQDAISNIWELEGYAIKTRGEY